MALISKVQIEGGAPLLFTMDKELLKLIPKVAADSESIGSMSDGIFDGTISFELQDLTNNYTFVGLEGKNSPVSLSDLGSGANSLQIEISRTGLQVAWFNGSYQVMNMSIPDSTSHTVKIECDPSYIHPSTNSPIIRIFVDEVEKTFIAQSHVGSGVNYSGLYPFAFGFNPFKLVKATKA